MRSVTTIPSNSGSTDEFWGYAAFFGGIEKPQNGPNQARAMPREITDRRELAIPGTGRVVQARFLDGNEPDWKPHVGARVTLAEWMTTRDNPFLRAPWSTAPGRSSSAPDWSIRSTTWGRIIFQAIRRVLRSSGAAVRRARV